MWLLQYTFNEHFHLPFLLFAMVSKDFRSDEAAMNSYILFNGVAPAFVVRKQVEYSFASHQRIENKNGVTSQFFFAEFVKILQADRIFWILKAQDVIVLVRG